MKIDGNGSRKRIAHIPAWLKKWTSTVKDVHYTSTTLPGLTPEILLMIVDHLSPSDIAAVALTCHILFDLLAPRCLPLTGSEREEFLQTYRRQRGCRFFYCYQHVRLHTLKPTRFWQCADPQPSKSSISRYSDCLYRNTISRHSHLEVNFVKARQVMDQELEGLDKGKAPVQERRWLPFFGRWLDFAGPDLRAFEKLWTYDQYRDTRTTVSWTPRIIHARLFMFLNQEINVSCGLERAPLELSGSIYPGSKRNSFNLCAHYSIAPLIQRIFEENRYGGWTHGSCNRCLTDYSIHAESISPYQSRIYFKAWYCLGACRTPEDPVWQSCVTANCRVEHEPGSILREYYLAESDTKKGGLHHYTRTAGGSPCSDSTAPK